MLGFLAFLLLGVAVFIVVCVLKYPEKLTNKDTGLPYTMQEVKYLVIGLVVFGLIFLSAASDDEKTSMADEPVIVRPATTPVAVDAIQPVASEVVKPVEPIKPKIEQVVIEPNLGMTPEVFRKKFNEQLRIANVSYLRELSEFDIDKGEKRNTFNVAFTKSVGMVGGVNKDGNLHGITFLMGKTDGDSTAGIDMVLLAALVSRVLNEESPKEETSKAVLKMMEKALNNIDSGDAITRVFGNVKYSVMASKYTGLIFTFEPNED